MDNLQFSDTAQFYIRYNFNKEKQLFFHFSVVIRIWNIFIYLHFITDIPIFAGLTSLKYPILFLKHWISILSNYTINRERNNGQIEFTIHQVMGFKVCE